MAAVSPYFKRSMASSDFFIFPDFSLTTLEFSNFSGFSRWVVTLLLRWLLHSTGKDKSKKGDEKRREKVESGGKGKGEFCTQRKKVGTYSCNSSKDELNTVTTTKYTTNDVAYMMKHKWRQEQDITTNCDNWFSVMPNITKMWLNLGGLAKMLAFINTFISSKSSKK